jgi:hypothetical protein
MCSCVGFELCQSIGIREDGQKFLPKQSVGNII